MTGSVAARNCGDEPRGDVLPFDDRRRNRPTGCTSGPAGEAETRVAVVVESLYEERGHTLTDPATAEAYDIALDAVARFIGALREQKRAEKDATRTENACGCEQLLGWIEVARCAPAVLGGEGNDR